MDYQAQRLRAIEVLRACCHPAGLRASGAPHGHHQVWARDSMISLLGASVVDDAQIRTALHASLATLSRHQTPAGAIPNNVDTADRPNFRAYADGGLWWVIGSGILAPDLPAIRRVLDWYACQDVDATGLISMQESSDWQDLFCTRGKGLYVNCVYTMALRKAAAVAAARGESALAGEWRDRAEGVRRAVNQYLWYRGDGQVSRHVAASFSTESPAGNDSLGRVRWMPRKRVLTDRRYYLPYVSFRDVGEWFDSLGNLLAILTEIADGEQTAEILGLIEERGLGLWPIRAMDPPVVPGDSDWREYYGTLNLPYHYHNGGIWPFIGGFYVAALVKTGRAAQAAEALERLAELNREGDFCEWHHGETGEAAGVREQAWSAAMFLYACECVEKGKTPYL